jgi:hypothetical protein
MFTSYSGGGGGGSSSSSSFRFQVVILDEYSEATSARKTS